MGKVLSTFPNGFPGAISRSVDNIVISMANGADADILFGAPLFFVPGQNACEPFSESSEAENFLGFSARAAVKTPETYGESEAVFTSGDPVDVLVRGSVVVSFAQSSCPSPTAWIPVPPSTSAKPTAPWSRTPAPPAPPSSSRTSPSARPPTPTTVPKS